MSRLRKLAVISIGALGGAISYYCLNGAEVRKFKAYNSWSMTYKPEVKWDSNWDCREPTHLVEPAKLNDAKDVQRFEEGVHKAKSVASRHILLIRHTQYNTKPKPDHERVLTELGRQQAVMLGVRLRDLGIKYNYIVRSSLTRAKETAYIIAEFLHPDLPMVACPMLVEGAPIPTEPPTGRWISDARFLMDGTRLEGAFRHYFYRAPPDQKEDTYTLLVCHANVIRFFVCRILQFPPDAWLRLRLNHGSITWIEIRPCGDVILRCLGETGFMDPKAISFKS